MQRKLSLSRDVVLHMMPLGTSLPCRLLASVILAVLTGAAMAAPDAPTVAAVTAAPASGR